MWVGMIWNSIDTVAVRLQRESWWSENWVGLTRFIHFFFIVVLVSLYIVQNLSSFLSPNIQYGPQLLKPETRPTWRSQLTLDTLYIVGKTEVLWRNSVDYILFSGKFFSIFFENVFHFAVVTRMWLGWRMSTRFCFVFSVTVFSGPTLRVICDIQVRSECAENSFIRSLLLVRIV